MSLLDDLKQQAESRKLEEQFNLAEKNRNLQAVHTALRSASLYFSELASSLNTLKLEISRTFHIDSITKLDNFCQRDYRARDSRKSVNHQDYFVEASLNFSWAGSKDVVVDRAKPMPMLVQRLHDHLRDYKLHYDYRESKNERNAVERAIFIIKAEVAAAATFSGNWDTGKVKLTLKHVEKLGSIDYQYDAPELNDVLFEELAKLILGRPNKLGSLGTYQEMLRALPTRSRA